jgi:hypothetical protein
MKPVVVIAGILLLLLIVAVCCTPKSDSDSDSDSNSSSDDSSNKSVAKGLGKTLDTGRMGYKYEDKMCVAVKEAPNGVDVFLTENECNYRHKTLGPDGKHHEHPHVHPYGPDGKHHVHPYGPDGKHHVHPYGPGGLEDGYKLVYDGKEEECIKVNKPIDNVNVLTKEVCEYKLENGYGPHGKGYRPDLKPKPQPHPGHDECTYEKNQYILINSN